MQSDDGIDWDESIRKFDEERLNKPRYVQGFNQPIYNIDERKDIIDSLFLNGANKDKARNHVNKIYDSKGNIRNSLLDLIEE